MDDSSLTYYGWLQTSLWVGNLDVCAGERKGTGKILLVDHFFILWRRKPITERRKKLFLFTVISSLFFHLFAFSPPLKGTLYKSSSIKIDYDTFFFLFRINVGT
jgi:hypothetical protein